MFGTSLAFAAPAVLGALLLLPAIWWLLRLMPPRPRKQAFPPTRLLAELSKKEDTPHSSPWWLTMLRLVLCAIVILALAGPLWQPNSAHSPNDNPLLLVVDNGWTTAQDWPKRAKTARLLMEDAARIGKPVALVMTTEPANADIRLEEPEKALERFTAQTALPYPEDRQTTSDRLNKAANLLPDVDVVWLASPLKTEADAVFAETLAALGDTFIRYDGTSRLAVSDISNAASALDINIKRLTSIDQPATLSALDKDGVSLIDTPVVFEDASIATTVSLELPIELRNEIVRLQLLDENKQPLQSVGATYLIDDRSRRRSVGLLSGGSVDKAQPLLSPLYYIQRALAPFADVRHAGTANVAEAVPILLQAGVSMIMMADVGTLPRAETTKLQRFMDNGGTLVRFAGPRLAASSDQLTPVRLRTGERNLGGSLTWDEPQKLARFSDNGPFAGMNLPDDIEIRRQVLAEPDFDLLQKTWAELEDGTPLVTAEPFGKGWLILFHVTADATWSNLPISGAFVDMLVKLVAFSSVPAGAIADNAGDTKVFPPFQTLDAQGNLGPPLETAEPIQLSQFDALTASRTTPPGFYGKAESLIAHNLMDEKTSFELLAPEELMPGADITALGEASTTDLRPISFSLAMLLLLADCIIVAVMAGVSAGKISSLIKTPRKLSTAAGIIFAMFVVVTLASTNSQAQEAADDFSFDVTLTTRLAYVITGQSNIDEISKAGLFGLTNFLSLRTALEPGSPVGVDISKDELAFFSLLYWPVSADVPVPDAATMARIDAFMKQGGTVLFDTRDQIDSGFNSATPATLKLREIVSNLDVPPLESVPANHVLTRAFYLLQAFPGRWIGSPLWVEAIDDKNKNDDKTRSTADGVSSILITANDFAGAWATDENARPLLPTVPSDPSQRVYAYRTGVNIVMYTLTGNYKADQVHIPALLERLGQ